MKKNKLIFSVALIATVSLTMMSVTSNAKTNNTEKSTAVSEEQKSDRTQCMKDKLTEKLEAGEITQEKYDEIISAIESGDFGGSRGPRGNWAQHGNWDKAGEMTDEQKTAITEKIKEKLTEKLEAGEITQEKYDEIISAIESGDFGNWEHRGNWAQHGNWDKAGELTDEQKAAFAEKRAEMAKKGGFGGFRGHCDNNNDKASE